MDRLRSRFPHAGDRLRAGGRPACRRTHGRPTAVPDHAIALDFVEAMRGTPSHQAEALLLQTAVDACCEDPDVDVLVSEAG